MHSSYKYIILMSYQDFNNFESDPEDFARTMCKDLDIEDPEVGVSTSIPWHPHMKEFNFYTHILSASIS